MFVRLGRHLARRSYRRGLALAVNIGALLLTLFAAVLGFGSLVEVFAAVLLGSFAWCSSEL